MPSGRRKQYRDKEEDEMDLDHETKETEAKSDALVMKGPWSGSEDALLSSLVSEFGPKDWSAIATTMSQSGYLRVGKQCRERWFNQLCPSVRKDSWSVDEDQVIISSVKKMGHKWTEISKLLQGRPANAVKNRWNSTLKRRLLQELPPGSLSMEDAKAAQRRKRKSLSDLSPSLSKKKKKNIFDDDMSADSPRSHFSEEDEDDIDQTDDDSSSLHNSTMSTSTSSMDAGMTRSGTYMPMLMLPQFSNNNNSNQYTEDDSSTELSPHSAYDSPRPAYVNNSSSNNSNNNNSYLHSYGVTERTFGDEESFRAFNSSTPNGGMYHTQFDSSGNPISYLVNNGQPFPMKQELEEQYPAPFQPYGFGSYAPVISRPFFQDNQDPLEPYWETQGVISAPMFSSNGHMPMATDPHPSSQGMDVISS